YPSAETGQEIYSGEDLQRTVEGGGGRSYRIAVSPQFGHDSFYTDSLIRSWYKSYISMILQRVNTYSGIPYRNEPSIFGWELANEPRSSDRSAGIVTQWVEELSHHVKSLDTNHLVGTGEEGFDITRGSYSTSFYNNQQWLFDGTSGVSFLSNSAVNSIDFASIHLYPESWNLPNNSGNVWIRDHRRLAGALRKPLVLGEFGVRTLKAPTYDSWLTTMLLDGAAGGLVWQVLEGLRGDAEGFGFRCFQEFSVCSILRNSASLFSLKSQTGALSPPAAFSLRQNYPNPFNGVTTISYSLPEVSHVSIGVFNITGEHVTILVDDVQEAGERKELFDARSLASGIYFYRVISEGVSGGSRHTETKKLIFIK
ncbi:MAG: T9SS type A sorting domain-containing protein, partial [Ignavibacteriae bacterium]|nr:T9SS type A sorting domain-containing protein [Ignavibacteriota bacterium]